MEKYNNKSVKDHYLKKARSIIYNKYSKNITNKYNSFIIHCILSNAKCHIVSLFKDFLLYEDNSEFLKRPYKGYETYPRLKKISKFFKETSVLYPNYSPLIESKYIYSNIIKKQIVINKQENYNKKKNNKNNNIKRHHHIKIEKENINDKNFFNSTIYNDILNESESFMNLLFGIENKNEDKEKKNDKKKIEEKDIDEVIKIIDMINNNEDSKNNKNILDNNMNIIALKTLDNSNRMHEIKVNVSKRNSNIINNSNSINTDNIKWNTSSGKIFNKRYQRNHRKIIRIEKPNKINSLSNIKNNINNNNYETSIENNTIINSPNVNRVLSSKKKIIYHRKVKSTLMGNYLNKLELLSNSNVVNVLKLANETCAENSIRNSASKTLYKGIKYNKTRMKNSTNNMKLPRNKILGKNIFSERKYHNSNSKISINSKTEIISSQEIPNNNISGFIKLGNNSKKIEVTKKKNKNNYFGIKKRGSPLKPENYTSIISFYENCNKKENNDKSIENLFSKTSDNNIFPTNSIFYSSKKPESRLKSIYVNYNFTGPYSKPKCIYKEKKLKGVSAKKLFNKPNEFIKKIKGKEIN